MKIMGRALWGMAATVLFTAGILFAVDSVDSISTIDSMESVGGGHSKEDAGGIKKPAADMEYRSARQVQQAPQIQRQAEQAGQVQQDRQQVSVAESGEEAAEKEDENAFRPVSEEYFSDAVFIGDSRTVGMQQSGLIPNAVYYAKVGIGIGELLSSRFIWEDGMSLTVPEALARHSFGKVYIMAGINDMSAGDTDWFVEQYREILRVVQETQPDAVVYIQGNIPMGYYKQDMSGALNNPNLAERNQASRGLADGEHVFYLDISSVYADSNGHLLSQYTSDGLHVLKKFYPLWVDYLSSHAVVHG